MSYKVLIIDHDDTVVISTETIHYPCFISFMMMHGRDMREQIPIEKYLEYNLLGDIREFYLDKVGLPEELLAEETLYWRECVNNCVPKVYDGLREILIDFKDRGGKIFVASHSEKKFILRDYEENRLPTPDGVFGYDAPRELRKPSAKIVDEVISRTGCKREEILIVDDLKHGYDMARASGVAFAYAGWSHSVIAIVDFMKKSADFHLEAVEQLRTLLLK